MSADEWINGFYLWNHWRCEMKSTFSSLFYLTLRKCAVWFSFSLLIQNKRWGFWRAKQIRKDQSVEQSNQCFLSSSSLKCLSNKCAKRRRATGSDRHRLRVKAMSENLMWQLESVRHCYLTPRHGSKTHQMHYWSRNITANFTWHEYANLRNITSYTALCNLTKSYVPFWKKILPVERTNQKWYLYNFPIVSPRQQWNQIESICRLPIFHLLRWKTLIIIIIISSKIRSQLLCSGLQPKSAIKRLKMNSNISHFSSKSHHNLWFKATVQGLGFISSMKSFYAWLLRFLPTKKYCKSVKDFNYKCPQSFDIYKAD